MFKSVDWKVLGLLLGLSDNTLERIQDESHTLEGCRESMILHWINTGYSYWSVLVDVLKGPVLGELKLANDLMKAHLGNLAHHTVMKVQLQLFNSLTVTSKSVYRVTHVLIIIIQFKVQNVIPSYIPCCYFFLQ